MTTCYAFDTETKLIQPGRVCPPVICLTYSNGKENQILDRHQGLNWLLEVLRQRYELVGHNVAYDFGAAVHTMQEPLLHALVWAAYDKGRVSDTGIREMLRKIAKGWHEFDPRTGRPPSYALAGLVDEYLSERIEGKDGDDAFRFRYHELEDVPIQDWPEEAKAYALGDADYTYRVDTKQREGPPIANQVEQCQAAWALHLLSAWGMRTEPEAVDALEEKLTEHVTTELAKFVEQGLYRWEGTKKEPKRKLTKNTAVIQAKVEAAYRRKAGVGPEAGGHYAPVTEGAQEKLKEGEPWTPKMVSMAGETLKESGDEQLEALGKVLEDQGNLTKYMPFLKQAATLPVNPRYNLVATGRTSASGPPIQQLPRKGGIRECFVPRPGFIFGGADYSSAELVGMAQILVDKYGLAASAMAQTLVEGRQILLVLAAGIIGITYDEAVERYKDGDKLLKDMRQLSKAPAYGFMGGMGAPTFVKTSKEQYNIIMCGKSSKPGPEHNKAFEDGVCVACIEAAKELKGIWLTAFPEMKRYFKEIGDRINREGGSFDLEQHRSLRVRGGVGFCDGANGYFQAIVADGAKAALYAVQKECYLGVPYTTDLDALLDDGWDGTAETLSAHNVVVSDLYGSRGFAFMHDEIILEVPDDLPLARKAVARLSAVMVAEMQRFCPDIPVKAEANLCRRWYKGSEPVFNEDGELIPWEPKAKK